MNSKLKIMLLTGACLAATISIQAQQVDYSVVTVPEESGTRFIRISSDADYVCMPIVKRSRNGQIDWLSNRILDTSVDGTHTLNLFSSICNTFYI